MKRSGYSIGLLPAKKTKSLYDVNEHLERLRDIWPRVVFEDKLPPVVMKHQLYSLHSDRTEIDSEVMKLIKTGKTRLFKMTTSQDDYAIMYTADYLSMFDKLKNKPSGLYKLPKVLDMFKDVSISKKELTEKLSFSEDEISHLVGAGCLVVREVEGSVSWWFSIPGVGAFVKQLLKGRAAMIQLLKKTKYREMLQQEAEKRTLAGCRLPTVYIVYDIIGSDSVDCIETSSGTLLRWTPP